MSGYITPLLPPYEANPQRASGLHDPDKKRSYIFRHFLRDENQATVTLTIGRSLKCDIQISNQATSRRHARIEYTVNKHAILRSDKPTNGLHIDGRPWIEPVILVVGMRIRLGEARLIATDEQGLFPIPATTLEDFMCQAGTLYGSYTLAAERIGRAAETVRRAGLRRHQRTRKPGKGKRRVSST